MNHKTDDFNKWKSAFDSMEPVRKQYGSSGATIFRGHADPNDLVIITHWGSSEQARKYSQSPELKAAMQKGGVVGGSSVYYVE